MPRNLQRVLLLVDGAAGTGKSDMLTLLRWRHRQGGFVGVVTKITTRSERPEESDGKVELDLTFASESEFEELANTGDLYHYEYGGKRYGLSRRDLLATIAANQITVAIVRNSGVLRRIKDDFCGLARVVVVFVYTDQSLVPERLRADGYSEEYINLRLSRGKIAWDDYLRHPRLYERVLLNNSSRNDFERLVEDLLEELTFESGDELSCDATGTTVRLPAALVGYKQGMVQRLSAHRYENNVFLMMKFRESNYETSMFIRETVAAHGFNCVRADDPEWNITGDVYNPVAVLCCCRYGIALFDEAEPGSHYSPNVAYELGIMHQQQKRCLILRHASLPAPPFDLISQLHVTYSRDLELRAAVRTWLGRTQSSASVG